MRPKHDASAVTPSLRRMRHRHSSHLCKPHMPISISYDAVELERVPPPVAAEEIAGDRKDDLRHASEAGQVQRVDASWLELCSCLRW